MKKTWAVVSIVVSIITALSVILSIAYISKKLHRQSEVQERSYTTIE